MPRPRRRSRSLRWPTLKQGVDLVTVILLAALLLCLGAYLHSVISPARATTTVVPQPQPTWTTYVPEMPRQCLDMLEVADALYDTSSSSDQATLKAAQLAADGARQGSPAKLMEAGRAIEQAEKYAPKLKDAREKFLDQYRKCADA